MHRVALTSQQISMLVTAVNSWLERYHSDLYSAEEVAELVKAKAKLLRAVQPREVF